MDEKVIIADLLRKIEAKVDERPSNLECVITELNSLINEFDPNRKKDNKLPLYPNEFQYKDMLNTICKKANQKLSILQLRFKADQLSKKYGIPFPTCTRKHQETMLLWYRVNWDILENEVASWVGQKIPTGEENT